MSLIHSFRSDKHEVTEADRVKITEYIDIKLVALSYELDEFLYYTLNISNEEYIEDVYRTAMQDAMNKVPLSLLKD